MKGRELERFEREDKIWQFRILGMSYREIAAEVGLSHMQVGNILNARLETMVSPKVEEYRSLMSERLEGLFRTYYPLAQQGDRGAAQMALKVLQEEAKLFGLYANPGESDWAATPIGRVLYSLQNSVSVEVIRTEELESGNDTVQ